MLRRIFTEALVNGRAHDNLRSLVTEAPGRLSGSKNLERAVAWAETTLNTLKLDRVYKQEVTVPHWERGAKETVVLVSGDSATPLNALALGNSGATTGTGLVGEVIEVQSIEELTTLGRARIEGRIVFFNRAMDPAVVDPSAAYSAAAALRSRGPLAAAKAGAIAALTRSLTFARDDVPHTGSTTFPPDEAAIPAAALSMLAADKLSAALARAKRSEDGKAGGTVRVAIKIDARKHPDARSHNVIGELRGSEVPEEIILVGGHLDSWDIAPGAHDDGAGCVQAIEVLRIFRALEIAPRHTLRCVLFTNEENGLRGSAAYVSAAKENNEKHIFAVESDQGGFQPVGFELGSTQGDAHERAARWRALFAPYGLHTFAKGRGGADVAALLVQGVTVGQVLTARQRYFDYHHSAADTLDKVNPRELHLGAAAVAALVWLVDTQGL